MHKNPQKQRMNLQLNQIRSILDDFRKTKQKCVELAKCINIEMPKQQHFKNIEKTTLRKMDWLDLSGLVNLKNQLVIALTQLFQIQRESRYKKQKHDARKQIMQTQTEQIDYIPRKNTQSSIQSLLNAKENIPQSRFKSIFIQQNKQELQAERPRLRNKNLQIPLFRAKTETNENKLDRISKYIASLKRNMKLNSQTLGYKWKIKQFLMEDQSYLGIRNQLQKFMMRQEELDQIFAKAVEKGIRQYIKKSQIVESNSQFKLIKIYKQNPDPNKTQNERTLPTQTQRENFNAPAEMSIRTQGRTTYSPKDIKASEVRVQYGQFPLFASPKIDTQRRRAQLVYNIGVNSPINKLSTTKQIKQKAEEDFNSIKKELQKSNESYIQMLSQINQTVEKGSQRLTQLRQKRKKKLQKSDGIWDQLQNI